MTSAHLVHGFSGDSFELGRITMRLLAGASQTNGDFSIGEFSGEAGPWTVPHIHARSEESFYVLEGKFIFTLDHEEVEVSRGSFILVPRQMRHEIHAGPDGGRLLALWTPAGLEAMFMELSRMPADSLRDPEVRKAISARFDSIPV